MSRSVSVCLHVGFPKTGTTTLQKHLFSKHSGIHYVGKPYVDVDLENGISSLIQQDSIAYDPGFIRAYWCQLREEIKGRDEVLLLSDERLVSPTKVRDRGIVAARLHDVFRPCKILITIRNQLDILVSAYVNGGCRIGGVSRFSGLVIELDEWLTEALEKRDRSYIGCVDYDALVRCYVELFGRENVFVLLFEELRSDPFGFSARIAENLGVGVDEACRVFGSNHENARLRQSEFDFARLRTAFFPVGENRIGRFLFHSCLKLRSAIKGNGRTDVSIPNEWVSRLSDCYRSGNSRLAKEFNLPLDRYGYPV